MGSFGSAPTSQDGVPLSSAWNEANNTLVPIRGRYPHTDTNDNTTQVIEVAAVEATSATTSNAAADTSVVVILAANSSTKGVEIYNDSTSAMYLKKGSGASTTSFSVKIPAGGYYESPASPIYTGQYTAVWEAATGTARVTQLT
jgi:hypothetical protein